jgi:hemoglobin
MCRSTTAFDKPASQVGVAGHTGCACSTHSQPMAVAEAVRWKEASADLDFPPVPLPSQRIFAVAGEPMLRALVQRHHERLRESNLAHLFPADPDRFALAVEKSADFIIEATGGSPRYTPAHGDTCMRTRHYPFLIDESAREVWLAQLLLSFDEVGFPHDIHLEFWDWLEALSIRMINRRTMRAQPKRYPLIDAPVALFPFMTTRRRVVMCPR